MTPTSGSVVLAMVGVLGGAAWGGWSRTVIFCHSVVCHTVRDGAVRRHCPSCAESLVPDRRPAWSGRGQVGRTGRGWPRAHPLFVLGGAWRWRLPGSGRCPRCRVSLGPPPWSVELSTAVACGALAVRISSLPLLVTLWWLTAASVALAAVDAAVHRLPDALTGRAAAGLAVGLGLTSLAERQPGALLRAAVAGLVLFAAYCGLALLSPTSMGFGDCKLAAVLGAATGFVGWAAVVAGTVLAFTLAAGYSLILIVLRRVGRRDPIAFGPFMLLGALVAILSAT